MGNVHIILFVTMKRFIFMHRFLPRQSLLLLTGSGNASTVPGLLKRILLIPLFALDLTAAHAQEEMLPTPDAKVLGMGGVAMATLPGAHAIYDNAAMALFAPQPLQISSSYYRHEKSDYYAVTGHWRFDNDNMVQVGWRQYLREAGGNDMAADAGYVRRLGRNWSVGAVGRYVHSKRPGGKADALAADLSVAWSKSLVHLRHSPVLRAGAKASNIGGYLKGKGPTLPMEFTAGAALDTYLSDSHEITVAADAGYRLTPKSVRGFQGAIGAEYNLMQLVQLRAGYHFGEHSDIWPDYASVGAGVRFLHLRLDFAYLFAKKDTPLHNTYSLSFGFDF